MLTDELRDLVHAATTYAVSNTDGADHTVGAALQTASGAVAFGLNTHHFSGGACAEVAALSNHAASHPEDPVVAAVAVYGPTRDVVSPCGKCRQILFDLDPAIECVVRAANGLTAVPMTKLLPHAFDWQMLQAPQRLYMWEGYEASIRDRSKTQTIRVDDPFRPGPAVLVFEKESGEVVELDAGVTDVRTVRRDELTEQDAVRDGFASLAELHAALDTHYSGLAPSAPVDVVSFSLPAE